MTATKKKNGWPYLLIAISICLLFLLSRDSETSIAILLLYGTIAGYILGMLWFSASDLLLHWYRWIFDVRHYRHYMKSKRTTPTFVWRWKP